MTHYRCLTQGSAAGEQYQPGFYFFQEFTAQGSQIVNGSLWLTASDDGTAHRAKIALYSEPRPDPAARIGNEVEKSVPVPITPGQEAYTEFSLDPSVFTTPGTRLWIIVRAVDPVRVFRQDSSGTGTKPDGCWIGSIAGTE